MFFSKFHCRNIFTTRKLNETHVFYGKLSKKLKEKKSLKMISYIYTNSFIIIKSLSLGSKPYFP